MTITVIQEASTRFDAATDFTRAFGSNVAAGSLVVVVVWSSSTAAFVAGNCTKSAGTATIGTVTLDKENDFDVGSGEIANAAIWSAIVTGAGSLTMNVAVPDGSYGTIVVGEYGGSWDSARLEDSQVGQNATDNTTAIDTANLTSAGAGLFIGATAVMGSETLTSITANSPFSSLASEIDNTSHQAGAAARNNYASGTTDTVGWALPANANRGWTAVGAVYKEAGAGTITGTGAITLGAMTVAGTAERTITSTGAITLGAIVVAGTGAVSGEVTGTGAITLGPIEVDGTAEREITDVGGAINLTLPAITVAGSGTSGADLVTGTGAIALGAVTVSGTAEREIPGAGAITLGSIALAGTGKRSTDATGAIVLGALQVSGQALLSIDGTGAITLGAIEVSGFDVAPVVRDDLPAGGLILAFERQQAHRRKRKREIEEADEAARELKSDVDREIAQLMQERERKAEFVDNLARLARIVERYDSAAEQTALSERVRTAIARAQAQESVSAYLALQRELERQFEEEEFAILMILAND